VYCLLYLVFYRYALLYAADLKAFVVFVLACTNINSIDLLVQFCRLQSAYPSLLKWVPECLPGVIKCLESCRRDDSFAEAVHLAKVASDLGVYPRFENIDRIVLSHALSKEEMTVLLAAFLKDAANNIISSMKKLPDHWKFVVQFGCLASSKSSLADTEASTSRLESALRERLLSNNNGSWKRIGSRYCIEIDLASVLARLFPAEFKSGLASNSCTASFSSGLVSEKANSSSNTVLSKAEFSRPSFLSTNNSSSDVKPSKSQAKGDYHAPASATVNSGTDTLHNAKPQVRASTASNSTGFAPLQTAPLSRKVLLPTPSSLSVTPEQHSVTHGTAPVKRNALQQSPVSAHASLQPACAPVRSHTIRPKAEPLLGLQPPLSSPQQEVRPYVSSHIRPCVPQLLGQKVNELVRPRLTESPSSDPKPENLTASRERTPRAMAAMPAITHASTTVSSVGKPVQQLCSPTPQTRYMPPVHRSDTPFVKPELAQCKSGELHDEYQDVSPQVRNQSSEQRSKPAFAVPFQRQEQMHTVLGSQVIQSSYKSVQQPTSSAPGNAAVTTKQGAPLLPLPGTSQQNVLNVQQPLAKPTVPQLRGLQPRQLRPQSCGLHTFEPKSHMPVNTCGVQPAVPQPVPPPAVPKSLRPHLVPQPVPPPVAGLSMSPPSALQPNIAPVGGRLPIQPSVLVSPAAFITRNPVPSASPTLPTSVQTVEQTHQLAGQPNHQSLNSVTKRDTAAKFFHLPVKPSEPLTTPPHVVARSTTAGN
jgi:hypothetical protein